MAYGIRDVNGFHTFPTAFSLLSLLVLMTITTTSCTIDVPEFFPEINGNLLKVKWAHGVNSMEKLMEAINGDAMMLEADILMGTTSASDDILPIMAHPPNVTSDLTLRGFLDTILKANVHKKKGIKLDFKELAAVEPVLRMLEAEYTNEKLNFPVWLNADVLKGPVNSLKEPINGTTFITLVKRYLSTATLSLGWTTRYGRDEHRAAILQNLPYRSLKTIKPKGYTKENVFEMTELLGERKWEGRVTFAVRAGLLTAKSVVELGTLMTQVVLAESISYTIWSMEDDPVNMKLLKDWVLFVQEGKVYLDLPFDLEEGPTIIPDTDTVSPSDDPHLGQLRILQPSRGSTTTSTLPILFTVTLILGIFS